MRYQPKSSVLQSARMNWDLSLNRHVTIRHHYEHSQSSGVKRLSVHFWKNHMYVHLGADGVCDRRTEIKTNEAVTKKNDKHSFSSFLKHDLSASRGKRRCHRLWNILASSHYLLGWKEKGRFEKKKKRLFDGEDEQRSDTRVRKARKDKTQRWRSRRKDKRMIYR